jgi:sugar/nucleoside kinase (ribokinase family)
MVTRANLNFYPADGRPLVVVGSINADLVLSVERLPAPGETIGAKDLEFFPGGKVTIMPATKQN